MTTTTDQVDDPGAILRDKTARLKELEQYLRRRAVDWIVDLQTTFSYLPGKRYFFWHTIEDHSIRNVSYWTYEVRRGQIARDRQPGWILATGQHRADEPADSTGVDYQMQYNPPDDLVLVDFDQWSLRFLGMFFTMREQIELDLTRSLDTLLDDYERHHFLPVPGPDEDEPIMDPEVTLFDDVFLR